MKCLDLVKKAVVLNLGVKAEYSRRILKIKGPKGDLELNIPEIVDLKLEEKNIKVITDFSISEGRTMAGTIRSLINNMVLGVSQGFTKTLELKGVGYRAQLKGKILTLSLGYSNPVDYKIPETVNVQIEGNSKITLYCCNKQVLGQTVAEIRKFRPPEPYKGKGILFTGEKIRRKAGKAAKASV